MTVKQLRNKLKNLPENAVVTIPNSNMYNNGDYDIDLVQYSSFFSVFLIYFP